MPLRPELPGLPAPRAQAPLLPRVRGQFAEFPRPGYTRHALGSSPRGTCLPGPGPGLSSSSRSACVRSFPIPLMGFLGLPFSASKVSPAHGPVGSRYGHGGSFPTPFSLAPGIGRSALNGRPFPPSPGSRHYGPPRASAVRRGDGPARPTPRRQRSGLRCRTYPRGTGILTGFPFGWLG